MAARWERLLAGIREVQEHSAVNYARAALREVESGDLWKAFEYATAWREGGAMHNEVGHLFREALGRGSSEDHMYTRDIWCMDVVRALPGACLEGTQVKFRETNRVGCDIFLQMLGGARSLQLQMAERTGADPGAFGVRTSLRTRSAPTESVHRRYIDDVEQVDWDELVRAMHAFLGEHVAELEAAEAAELEAAKATETAEAAELEARPYERLRPWQQRFMELVVARAGNVLMLHAAPGLGKTVAGSIAARRVAGEHRVLWITPSLTLVDDAVAALWYAGHSVHVLGDGEATTTLRRGAPGRPLALVVVANSAHQKAAAVSDWAGDRYYCVVDEVHRLLELDAELEPELESGPELELRAETRRAAVTRLLRGARLGGLCMSATPGACLFVVPPGDRFLVSYAEGVDAGHLVPYRIEIPLLTRNDAAAWAEHLSLKPSLLPAMVVVDSIETIHEHVRAYREVGLAAETINSRGVHNTKKYRRLVQRRLRSLAAASRDPLDVLVVVKCCLEGLDLPMLRTVAFAHMPASTELVVQGALRSSRASADPHKHTAVLLAPLVVGDAADAASAQDAALRLDRGNYEQLSVLCRGLAQLESADGDAAADELAALRRVQARCHVDIATHDRTAAVRGDPAGAGDLGVACAGRSLGSLADELLERVVARAPLDDARWRVAAVLDYLVRTKGNIPPRGKTTEGFDMGVFWDGHVRRGCHEALFEADLAKSTDRRKYYELARARAEETKRAKQEAEEDAPRRVAALLDYLVRTEGTPPPQSKKTEGFAMGKLWSNHMRGKNKEVFQAELAKSADRRKYYELARAKAEEAKRAKQEAKEDAPRKVAALLDHLVQTEGTPPPRGEKTEGFDMGSFWNRHVCQGPHEALFEAELAKSTDRRKYYELARARNEEAKRETQEAKEDAPRKVAALLDYLVRSEGNLPPRGKEIEGFDMGMFWNGHVHMGCHKALFQAEVAKSADRRKYYELALSKRKSRAKRKRSESI